MKKLLVILCLVISPFIFAVQHTDEEGPVTIPETPQRPGDSAKGYEYLTTGNYLRSGVPYDAFIMANGKVTSNLLNRTGKNATVRHAYNVIEQNGVEMVIPTCLQCHSSFFDGKLVIGLGNNAMDFSHAAERNFDKQIRMLKVFAPKQYAAAAPFFTSFKATYPYLETEVRGVNPADKLAMVLVAHRNPKTLVWGDTALIDIPKELIPTDVPAWWLMRKKNGMFYTGFARGDLAKFLMLSNILTVSDSSEAREVSARFNDVLAYVKSLRPPAYPKNINAALAKQGRAVFTDNCSSCHGTYGPNEYYPNLLIPSSVIRTDSALWIGLRKNVPFIDWFRNSWFGMGTNPAYISLFDGYIAPPLDGVWATAPYLHNGSVPNLELLLNSKRRPRYWTSDFNTSEYDYEAIGVKYTTHDTAIAKYTYNTDLPGYGNSGHYFGDLLNETDRKAVIEYLKTL